MKVSRLWLIALAFGSLLVAGGPLVSCDNEYTDNPEVLPDYDKGFPDAAYVRWLQGKHEGAVIAPEEKLAKFKETGDFRDESNYATALMRSGEHQQAREIFARLAAEHPDEYILAANLGTAYELTGDNEQALTWIRKGMELNPESHNGTEWLHIKILEAKQQADKDPEWFDKHSVLNLEFGVAGRPATPAQLERDDAGQPLTLEAIRKAIEYQLHERLFYVKPKDVVVANLLETLGNLLILDGPAETDKAFNVFVLASDYSPAPSDVLAARLSWSHPQNRAPQLPQPVATPAVMPAQTSSNAWYAVLAAAVAAGAVVVTVVCVVVRPKG